MAKRDVFLKWLQTMFKAKSIAVFRNWGDFYFVYLSAMHAEDTKMALWRDDISVEMTCFLWSGASSSGWIQQQKMQEKAGRENTYDGDMILVHMPSLKQRSTNYPPFPMYAGITTILARDVIGALLKTLETGHAIEDDSNAHEVLAYTNFAMLAPGSSDLDSSSDVAFAACEVGAESTVYQKIPKTLAEMKIHTDLAGYHQF